MVAFSYEEIGEIERSVINIMDVIERKCESLGFSSDNEEKLVEHPEINELVSFINEVENFIWDWYNEHGNVN